MALYGSQVAGYARDDSDYDLLVVLKNYRERARYKYIHGTINLSVLLVDSDALSKDASTASLGEFVVGRLLNVYQPILGSDFFWEVEVAYKRRVAMELLAEIVASYGDFSSELLIPPAYFLFEKLRKRAAIYPPALYSYAKTYTGPMKERNIGFSVEGFSDALDDLAAQGLILRKADHVRLLENSIRRGQLAKLSQLATSTARGLRQYAVHSSAGRVGLGVVGREALSKIRRTREAVELPLELKNPRSLWRIEEGALILDGGNWREAVLESLGHGSHEEIRTEHLGELYNVTRVYAVGKDAKSASFVVKYFRDFRSFKWALLNLWTLTAKRFNMSPLARLHRQFRASLDLRRLGVLTPEILAVVLNDRILVTKFVQGENLGQIVSDIIRRRTTDTSEVNRYGEVLALLHSVGYTVGDTKGSNAIHSQEGIYLTDLEQASKEGDPAWDIAEFLYFSCKLTPQVSGSRTLTRTFLEGYLRVGSTEIVRKALHLKYLAPFQPFLTPQVTQAVRKAMREAATRVSVP